MTREALLALALLSSCTSNSIELTVDVKTDLVGGRNFVGVEIELGRGDETLATESAFATSGEDWLAGVRVAEFADVPKGDLWVRLLLRAPDGTDVATRTTRLAIRESYALTVLVTASCIGVSCPRDGDDPTHSACLGGRCVDPRCSPETPEFCGDIACNDAGECSSPISCGVPQCVDSVCFVRLDDTMCEPGEVCQPEGCRLGEMFDGGTCPPIETLCSDGRDEDCDGLVDCEDPDCEAELCDDGDLCTEGDTCSDRGMCEGTPRDCNDDNPCTDDACDASTGGCVATPNTAACDDGLWCNGSDRCAGGSCSEHTDPPCTDFCNESTMACEACRDDVDCGTETVDPWGPCGGFGSTCDETGTQTRIRHTPRCNTGTCEIEDTMESQACMRDTDGTTCGTTTFSSWVCGGFSNACDETGTETRTRTERRCAAASCQPMNFPESRACSRSVPNGTVCGGTQWHICCGTNCIDTRNNDTRCGSCRVSCAALGLTCEATGTGGYACRGCDSDAECQTELDSEASCWNVMAPPAFCQCQCTPAGVAQVCANGGCGANHFCFDCAGHNYCAPFNGSCP